MGVPTLRFVLIAGVGAAVIFGVLPALAALRHPAGSVRATRSGGSKGAARLRGGLVVAQVALSLSLLFGAGLLGKSFWRLQQVDLGFEPEGVLVAGLPIGDSDFASAEEREAYYQAVLERTQALPGVDDAALTSSAPFNGFGVVFNYDLLDRPGGSDEQRLARFRIVTPELFSTLGIPLLAGRTFTREETLAGGSPGAVVSQDFARLNYPSEDPLGRPLTIAGDTFDIVGVVPSLRDVTAREASPFPYVYVPVMPAVRQSMTLVVRADRDPAALVEPVRRAVRELAPAQPVTPLRPLPELVAESAARPRFTLQLLTFFAAATLLLSGVGLYGLLAYAVGRRTREIGVRVALGSPVAQVRALIMRQGVTLAAAGLLLGIALAAWGGRFLESLLFEVDARDPAVLGGVALTLLAVAVLASWFPARRATRITPVEALKAE
jgi:predicted permease